MANTLIVKRSSVAGKVPLSTDLQVGELAVNLADQKIYSKNAGGTVVELGGGTASGDVVGPASATDNALVRFDGTTGKLVQNSTATLDDTGNMDTASLKADYFDLDTAATAPADAVGRTAWDDGSGGSILGLKGGVVTYYTGQQEFARVYNGSGAAMTKGQVVYIVGAQGNRVDVRLARANAESTSANTIGFVAEPIAAGAEGWVQTTGPLPKLDTSTLTAGQTVYLSPTTAVRTPRQDQQHQITQSFLGLLSESAQPLVPFTSRWTTAMNLTSCTTSTSLRQRAVSCLPMTRQTGTGKT